MLDLRSLAGKKNAQYSTLNAQFSTEINAFWASEKSGTPISVGAKNVHFSTKKS
jgi:hypothetical protein